MADIKQKKKTIALDFFKRAGSILGSATGEYISEAFPIVSDNLRDARAALSTTKDSLTSANSSIIPEIRRLKRGIHLRNVMNWFYGKELEFGEESQENEDSKYSFDTDGISGDEDDYNPPEISETEKATNRLGEAITGGLKNTVEAQVSLTSSMINSLSLINSSISEGVNSINEILGQILTVVTKNSSTMIESVIASSVEAETDEEKIPADTESMIVNNRFDIKEYLKSVRQNTKHNPLASIVGVMIETATGMGGLEALLPTVEEATKSIVFDNILKRTMPNLTDNLQEVDKSINDFILSGLINIGNMTPNYGGALGQLAMFGMHPVSLLSSIFGINSDRENINTSKAELEIKPVPFDSLTRESIITTIPGYLRRILETISGKDLVYDNRSRNFKDSDSIRKEYLEKSTEGMSIYNASESIKDALGYDEISDFFYKLMVNELGSRSDRKSILDIFSDVFTTKNFFENQLLKGIDTSSKGWQDAISDFVMGLKDLSDNGKIYTLNTDISKSNIIRNKNVSEYVDDARNYEVDLSRITDGYNSDRSFLLESAGIGSQELSEVSLDASKGSLVKDIYSHNALYAIYKRLEKGINVFKTGEDNSRDKPYEEMNMLPAPDSMNNINIKAKDRDKSSLLSKINDYRSEDLDTTSVDDLIENEQELSDTELTKTDKIKAWAKSRGSNLKTAILSGSSKDVKRSMQIILGDITDVAGKEIKGFATKMNDQAGNLMGFVKHKLFGSEYTYKDKDENGNEVTKKVEKNEKNGALGFVKDYVKDMFGDTKESAKKWVKTVSSYFDAGESKDNDKDTSPDIKSKRKKFISASVGAMMGGKMLGGVLGGPIGMLLGGIAGNAIGGMEIGSKIKDLLFGRDSETGKAKGLLTKLSDAIIDPIHYQIAKTMHHIGNSLKKNIFGPLSDVGFAIKEAILHPAKVVMKSTFKKISDIILWPFKKAAKIITFPFRLLGKALRKMFGGLTKKLGGGLLKGLGWLTTKLPATIAGSLARTTVSSKVRPVGFVLNKVADYFSKRAYSVYEDPDKPGVFKPMYWNKVLKARRKKREEEMEDFDDYKTFQEKKNKKRAEWAKKWDEYTGEKEVTVQDQIQFEVSQENSSNIEDIKENTKRSSEIMSELKEKVINIIDIMKNGNAKDAVDEQTSGIDSSDDKEESEESKVTNFDEYKKRRDERRKQREEERNKENEENEETEEDNIPTSTSAKEVIIQNIKQLLGIGSNIKKQSSEDEIAAAVDNQKSNVIDFMKKKEDNDRKNAMKKEDEEDSERFTSSAMTSATNIGISGDEFNDREASLTKQIIDTSSKDKPNRNEAKNKLKELIDVQGKSKKEEPEKKKTIWSTIWETAKSWLSNPMGLASVIGGGLLLFGNKIKDKIPGIIASAIDTTLPSLASNVLDSLKKFWNWIRGRKDVPDEVDTKESGPLLNVATSLADMQVKSTLDYVNPTAKVAHNTTDAAGNDIENVNANNALNRPWKAMGSNLLRESLNTNTLRLLKHGSEASGDTANAQVYDNLIKNKSSDVITTAGKYGVGKTMLKTGARIGSSAVIGMGVNKATSTVLKKFGVDENIADAVGEGAGTISQIRAMTGKGLSGKASKVLSEGIEKGVTKGVSVVKDTGIFKTILNSLHGILDTILKLASKNKLLGKVIPKISKLLTQVKTKLTTNVLQKMGSKVTKIFARETAEATAGAATLGIGYAVMGTIGGVAGFMDTARLFSVDKHDVDMLMRTISTALGAVLDGVPYLNLIEIIDLVICPLNDGKGLRQILAECIYKALTSEDKLNTKQSKLSKGAQEYNEKFGTNLSTADYNDAVNGSVSSKILKGRQLYDKDGNPMTDESGKMLKSGGLSGLFVGNKNDYVKDENGNIVTNSSGVAIQSRDQYGNIVKQDEKWFDKVRKGFNISKQFLFGGDIYETDEEGKAILGNDNKFKVKEHKEGLFNKLMYLGMSPEEIEEYNNTISPGSKIKDNKELLEKQLSNYEATQTISEETIKQTENTGNINEQVGLLAEKATEEGSIYTHDIGIHEKLDKMISLLSEDGETLSTTTVPNLLSSLKNFSNSINEIYNADINWNNTEAPWIKERMETPDKWFKFKLDRSWNSAISPLDKTNKAMEEWNKKKSPWAKDKKKDASEWIIDKADSIWSWISKGIDDATSSSVQQVSPTSTKSNGFLKTATSFLSNMWPFKRSGGGDEFDDTSNTKDNLDIPSTNMNTTETFKEDTSRMGSPIINTKKNQSNKEDVSSGIKGGNPLSKKSKLTSTFGNRPSMGGFHYGIDLIPEDNSKDADVISQFDGTIMSVKNDVPNTDTGHPYKGTNSTGNYVSIKTDDNTIVKNYHLRARSIPQSIKPGVRIRRGEKIGSMGSTGHSTGEHLHYQIEKPGPNGKLLMINPINGINKNVYRNMSTGRQGDPSIPGVVLYDKTKNLPARSGKIEYIVIHYTYGPDSSSNNRAWNTATFFTNESPNSADFIIDDNTIVQYNRDLDNKFTQHCGGSRDGKYGATYKGKCTNANSIGIEIESYSTDRKSLPKPNSPDWHYSDAVITKALALIKTLMSKYNIPASNVIRHYDTVGKFCPGIIGWNKDSGDESKWIAFKNALGDSSVQGLSGSSIQNEALGKWISIIKDVKQQIARAAKGYEYGGNEMTITSDGYSVTFRTDCSGFVSICLSCFAKKKIAVSSSSMMGNDSGLTSAGFTKYNWPGWEQLSAGDILVTDGHTEIFAYNDGNKHMVWNCGSDSSNNDANPCGSANSQYSSVWRLNGVPNGVKLDSSGSLVGYTGESNINSSEVSTVEDKGPLGNFITQLTTLGGNFLHEITGGLVSINGTGQSSSTSASISTSSMELGDSAARQTSYGPYHSEVVFPSQYGEDETYEQEIIDSKDHPENYTHPSHGWSRSANQGRMREDAIKKSRIKAQDVFGLKNAATIDDRLLIATPENIGNKLPVTVGDHLDVEFEDGDIWNTIAGDAKNITDKGMTPWGHDGGKSSVEIIYWDYSKNPENRHKKVKRVVKTGKRYDLFGGDYEGTVYNTQQSSSGKGNFPKYSLTQDQLKGISYVVQKEQSTKPARYAEASLIANLTDVSGDNKTSNDIVKTVTGGWFHDGNNRFNNPPSNVEQSAIDAVKDTIIEGKRTVPRYIDEHDYIGDITSVTDNGATISKTDRKSYKSHSTVIKNRQGSTYKFFEFPGNNFSGDVDPFGYKNSSNRTKWGDDHYDPPVGSPDDIDSTQQLSIQDNKDFRIGSPDDIDSTQQLSIQDNKDFRIGSPDDIDSTQQLSIQDNKDNEISDIKLNDSNNLNRIGNPDNQVNSNVNKSSIRISNPPKQVITSIPEEMKNTNIEYREPSVSAKVMDNDSIYRTDNIENITNNYQYDNSQINEMFDKVVKLLTIISYNTESSSDYLKDLNNKEFVDKGLRDSFESLKKVNTGYPNKNSQTGSRLAMAFAKP